MDSTGYKVELEKFQGPLGLLLDLVEKRKLFINEISLAKIADDYIAYIKNLEHFPMAESAQFILVASTLLLIKSKSLLPSLDLTTEEQASMEDLEKRLALYKRIRDLSLHVKEMFGKKFIFAKSQPKNIQPVFSPDESMTVPALLSALKDALKNLPKAEVIPKAVIRKVVSLEEMIGSLTERVQRSLKMSFRDFAKVGKEERIHVIVSFLAMLELVKQGIIHVSQEKDFEDISMETKEVGVPRYE